MAAPHRGRNKNGAAATEALLTILSLGTSAKEEDIPASMYMDPTLLFASDTLGMASPNFLAMYARVPNKDFSMAPLPPGIRGKLERRFDELMSRMKNHRVHEKLVKKKWMKKGVFSFADYSMCLYIGRLCHFLYIHSTPDPGCEIKDTSKIWSYVNARCIRNSQAIVELSKAAKLAAKRAAIGCGQATDSTAVAVDVAEAGVDPEDLLVIKIYANPSCSLCKTPRRLCDADVDAHGSVAVGGVGSNAYPARARERGAVDLEDDKEAAADPIISASGRRSASLGAASNSLTGFEPMGSFVVELKGLKAHGAGVSRSNPSGTGSPKQLASTPPPGHSLACFSHVKMPSPASHGAGSNPSCPATPRHLSAPRRTASQSTRIGENFSSRMKWRQEQSTSIESCGVSGIDQLGKHARPAPGELVVSSAPHRATARPPLQRLSLNSGQRGQQSTRTLKPRSNCKASGVHEREGRELGNHFLSKPLEYRRDMLDEQVIKEGRSLCKEREKVDTTQEKLIGHTTQSLEEDVQELAFEQQAEHLAGSKLDIKEKSLEHQQLEQAYDALQQQVAALQVQTASLQEQLIASRQRFWQDIGAEQRLVRSLRSDIRSLEQQLESAR